jgi:hypothetical protein
MRVSLRVAWPARPAGSAGGCRGGGTIGTPTYVPEVIGLGSDTGYLRGPLQSTVYREAATEFGRRPI